MDKKIPYHLILIFLILSIGIWIAGYNYYRHTSEQIKKDKEEDLSSIADSKVTQIVNWRKERLGDAGNIFNNPLIIPKIQQLLENESPELKRVIISVMESLREQYQYKSIILLDVRGYIRLAVPDGQEILGPDAKNLCRQAIRTGKVIFSDLYRGKFSDTIRLTLVVPLLAPKGRDTVPVGVLMLRIDPYQFLYPLIQTWPVPGDTSETILLRREGDEVVFLNELRHRKGAALTLRFPVSEKHLPAAKAMRGAKGTIEGIDYRGKEVIAAIREIPDSPWFLVAKIDKEEVYAPIRERFRIILILVSVLILAAGFGVGFLWRHQRADFYRTQYELEHEKSEAREALLEEKQFTDLVINSLPGVFYLFDENGRFLRWNRNLELNTAYSGEEISKMNPLDFFSEDDKKSIEDNIREVFSKGESSVEAYLKSKDGREFPYFFTGLLFVSGGKKYLVGMGMDIAKIKHAEEEIRKLNEELEKRVIERTGQLEVANNELQRRTVELEALNKELEAFSYSVSHDLRAPLRGIDGFSQALLEDYGPKLNEEAKNHLHRIRKSSQRMGQLIDDLLNLSRVTRGAMQHETVDLSELAFAISREIQMTQPERKAEFIITKGLSVQGDARLLTILLENLLGNAFKFTGKNPHAKIEFGIAEYESKPAYFVRDNGAGFDMTYADKLFGAFQRLHSQTEFPGTGIGLAIAKRIIHRHGGGIWAEAEINKGAAFYFTLQRGFHGQENHSVG